MEGDMPSFLNALERSIEAYHYLLPRGWRLIIEHESGDERLVLDLQSDKGGGSFAKVKMRTLKEMTPKKYATGGDDLEYILQTIRSRLPLAEECEMYQEICALAEAGNLTRKQHEWLRDIVGYTNFCGAVRIPYERNFEIIKKATSEEDYTGELRIAFSGASEEQDVMFTLRILREVQFLQCWYRRSLPYYGLQPLSKIPNIRLWLEELNIKETPQLRDFRLA